MRVPDIKGKIWIFTWLNELEVNEMKFFQLSGSYLEDSDREMHEGKPADMDPLMAKIDNVARTVNMQMHMKGINKLIFQNYIKIK